MASDDDTTQDPLFKNVPRRPRSAASWPPRKEEPDAGDPGGISVSNNASPLAAMASVQSNKRPASSTGSGGGAEHVPRAKKHRLVPIEEPKKHRHRLVPEPEDAKDRVVGALDRHGGVLGGMPLAHSHKDNAAASSASSSEAEAAVDWAENERCRKGKTPAVNEDDDACAEVARRPPAGSGLGNGKLLGDAIRSHRSTAAVAGSFKPPSRTTKPEKPRPKPKKPNRTRSKPNNKPMKKDSGPWFWCGTGKDGVSSAGSGADYSFDRLGVVSDRLRTTLRGLGVAAPVRLYGKLLKGCDRNNQQARLLMSYKKWRAAGEFPLCAFLTEEEKEEARGVGMLLTAYDRGGDAYELKFRFLECNEAFRLINNWGTFLRHNGLDVAKDEEVPVGDDVMLDLWMFRTPGGKAGMVLLHYRRGDAAHADAALDEVEQKRLQRQRQRQRQQQQQQPMLNNGAVADAAADAGAVMEDAVGDANEDAGVNGEVAAAVPAPSSSSEPSGGGGAIEAAEAGAPGELAGVSSPMEPVADAPSTSSELHGGAGRSDEVTAPLSLGGGDGTEKLQAEAGSALMVMVLEVEVAKQSSLGSNAGGDANEVAALPSSPEQAGGGAVMMAMEDEDAVAAEATSDEDEAAAGAAARSWNVNEYEFRAAQALMMISRANSDS